MRLNYAISTLPNLSAFDRVGDVILGDQENYSDGAAIQTSQKEEKER